MTLNGYTIPNPINNIKLSPLTLGKVSKTASGRRVEDIITIKNTISLRYLGLSAASMNIFNDAYESGAAVPFVYSDFAGSHTINVRVTVAPYEISRVNTATPQNVTILLEEV